jgi:hypothetical protein
MSAQNRRRPGVGSPGIVDSQQTAGAPSDYHQALDVCGDPWSAAVLLGQWTQLRLEEVAS